MLPQEGDDVGDRFPGDQIAQGVQAREDLQGEAFLLGDEVAGQILRPHAGGEEVCVVDDRVLDAGGGDGLGQVRFPHPFRQPEALRPRAEAALQVGRHLADLPGPVAFGDHGEDRLVVAARHELDLLALHQRAQHREELRVRALQPVQERAGVVHRHADLRVLLEGAQHGQVALGVRRLEDMGEVAHGLMVVDGQRE